jgi:hypothetical protein
MIRVSCSHPYRKHGDEILAKKDSRNILTPTITPASFVVSLVLSVVLSYSAGAYLKPYLSHLATTRTLFRPQGVLFEFPAKFHRTTFEFQDDGEIQCTIRKQLFLDNFFFDEELVQKSGDDYNDKIGNRDKEGPFAYQIMIDFQKIDLTFASSVDLIQSAIIDSVWEMTKYHRLRLKSLHCQQSTRVFCVALFNHGSHMIVATDPENFSCAVDIYFADSPGNLLNIIPILENKFGVGKESVSSFRHLLRAMFEYKGTIFEHDLADNLLQEKDRTFFKREVSETVITSFYLHFI